ncbi:two-component sensor histidine kinase [Fictibacillus macauensis ZFHKF-1]|uniref:histidine kinase n=1 Tax=Fictibacillus macauensis ZFHKF-1 TaxID=1196324 RepID=I8J1I7_9BACL|nr:PAS domain-containing sensor histidine kinase [Fictibacillus macauensis]EIT85596.1 two-component sensor histidine kinase [Fictibacillus macauensis ZFHKF-1]
MKIDPMNEIPVIQLMDAIASGVIVLAEDNTVIYVNDMARNILGIQEKVQGMHYEQASFLAMNESGLPLAFEDFPSQKTKVTGNNVQDELIGVVSPKHMTCKWYTVSTSPLQSSTGSTLVVITIAAVTEQKQMENARQKSEEPFRSLVTSMEDTVFTLNRDLIHTGVYGTWIKKQLIDPETLIGKSVSEIFGRFAAGHEEACLEVLEQGTCKIFEWSRERGDQTFYFQALLSPLINENGEVYGIVGVSRDITVQKQTELGLLESEERFRQFADNANDVFWMRDCQSKQFIYLSPSFERIWGRPREMGYENLTQLKETVVPEDLPIISSVFQYPHEQDHEIEYRIKRPDGELRWIRSRAFPIYDKQGTVCRMAGIAEDITNIKEQEKLLQKSDKLMVVGELAAGIAHEIRNPLTSIKGFMQLISPDIQDHIQEIILSELNRIESIINEFLILAKPHTDIEFQKKSINEVITQAMVLLHSEANLKNVQFKEQLSSTLPAVLCEGNQLKQVLINVIKNAIEAMHHGGIVTIQTALYKRRFIKITIHDEGIGISKERINRLGEPFYSNKEKGIGLGLMVSLKIIENHKGKITFSSLVNKGTTVTIMLPIDLHRTSNHEAVSE